MGIKFKIITRYQLPRTFKMLDQVKKLKLFPSAKGSISVKAHVHGVQVQYQDLVLGGSN